MPYAPDETTHLHPPADGYCPDWGPCPFGCNFCKDPSLGTLIACGGLVGDDRLCLHRIRRPMVISKAAQAARNEEGLLLIAKWAANNKRDIILRFGEAYHSGGKLVFNATEFPEQRTLKAFLKELASKPSRQRRERKQPVMKTRSARKRRSDQKA
jgi:hypothetical protein